METIGILDKKDYKTDWPRFVRHAVRAIIWRDGLLAMVHDRKHGEYKFPGGGIEPGEDHAAALLREIAEETGLAALPQSLEAYGQVLELRRDHWGDAASIFEHHSYYYRCAAGGLLLPTRLDDYEAELGFALRYVGVEEAIARNQTRLDNPAIPWVERDLYVLKRLLEEQRRG